MMTSVLVASCYLQQRIIQIILMAFSYVYVLLFSCNFKLNTHLNFTHFKLMNSCDFY